MVVAGSHQVLNIFANELDMQCEGDFRVSDVSNWVNGTAANGNTDPAGGTSLRKRVSLLSGMLILMCL